MKRAIIYVDISRNTIDLILPRNTQKSTGLLLFLCQYNMKPPPIFHLKRPERICLISIVQDRCYFAKHREHILPKSEHTLTDLEAYELIDNIFFVKLRHVSGGFYQT